MKKIYTILLINCFFILTTSAQTLIPVSNELVLPQYAYYGGTATARIHYVCRLTLTGLVPTTQYRYFVGMSTRDTSSVTSTPGVLYSIRNTATAFGNIDGFAVSKGIGGTFLQSDALDNTATLRYAQFLSNASGEYTGWFACAPNANAAQQPIGGNVYFYVHVNSPTNQFVIAQSFRTTSTIKLLDYNTTAGDINGATVITGTSDVGNEKIVCLYDNTGFTGRPIYTSFTENDGINQASLWTSWYGSVNANAGSWGGVIPNSVTGGIKGIKFFEIDGTEIVLSNSPNPNISNDGIWNGVSTANPAGGITPIAINSIAGGPIPVTLLNFSGEATKEGVKLYWQTTQEINNKYFEISRAGSDFNFKAIGTVNAAALPDLTHQYDFVDNQPINGKNYYRLKQVDKDGRSKLYNIIMVNTLRVNLAIRLISSGRSEIVVAIQSDKNRKGEIIYYNTQGSVLYKNTTSLKQGENIVRLPVASFSNQIGVISFISESTERMNLKVIR